MSLIGLIVGIVVCVLVAVWLAPLVPAPGGRVLSVLAWILAVVLGIYLLLAVLGVAGVGLGFDAD